MEATRGKRLFVISNKISKASYLAQYNTNTNYT